VLPRSSLTEDAGTGKQEDRPSVRPSVRLSHLSAAAVAGSEFAAVGPAGRICRSIAARPALNSNRAAVSPINAKELTQNSVVL